MTRRKETRQGGGKETRRTDAGNAARDGLSAYWYAILRARLLADVEANHVLGTTPAISGSRRSSGDNNAQPPFIMCVVLGVAQVYSIVLLGILPHLAGFWWRRETL